MKKWLSCCLAFLLLLCAGAPALAQGADSTAQPEATESAQTADKLETTQEPDAPAQAAQTDKAQWTVMIYLCGTDLESKWGSATVNLAEIAKTTPNAHVNVVIETGGTQKWQAKEPLNLDIATDKLQRYSYGIDGYKLIENQPLANMASAGTLTDFVQWGARTYPAEKYLLVLWDHGAGSLRGLILDELHDSMMPLDQLQIALENANVPLEVVLTDACLMANIETAQALQGSAKYLVSSEETVPGEGTSFQQWMQYLYNTPGCDGARFGKEVCDSIQQKYMELDDSRSSQTLTFSVIDLRKIDAVSQAFDKMFLEVSALLDDPEQFMAFGYFTQHMQRYWIQEMVDISDLASRTRNRCISNETAGDVIEAVSNAVVYSIKGPQRSYSHGLSFFYAPAAINYYMDRYARVCKSAPYLAFLDATNMDWTAPAWVYEQTPRLKDISYENYAVRTEAGLNDAGLPQLTVTNAKNAVAAVDLVLYQYDLEKRCWRTLGESGDVDMDAGNGVYTAELPDAWPSFGGQLCQLSIVEEVDLHTLYQIPVDIQYDAESSERFWLRTALIFDQPLSESYAATPEPTLAPAATPEPTSTPAAEPETAQTPAAELATAPTMTPGADAEAAETAETETTDPYAGHYELYGVWDQNSSSAELPSRNVMSIGDFEGMSMQLTYARVDYPSLEEMETLRSKPILLSENTRFAEALLPKGNYAIAFKVVDVFGKSYLTAPIEANWNGKTVTYSDPNAVLAAAQ